MPDDVLFQVDRLTKLFPVRGRGLSLSGCEHVHAVDRVSFTIRKGDSFGIVGQSGSGKTTLARLLLRLVTPTAGTIRFQGRDLLAAPPAELKRLRRRIQMIFQDPYGSLDPTQRVFDIVSEPLRVHRVCDRRDLMTRVQEALGLVDLPATEAFAWTMPHELSGGQRQRVGIARALVLRPEVIVADEPVSMLDASVKAGIVSLLLALKHTLDLTFVFITHDIALAYCVCNRIAVMYGGRIVELAGGEAIVKHPKHPYTALLMAAIPPLSPDQEWTAMTDLGDDLPAGPESLEGCRFAGRCAQRQDRCLRETPELIAVGADHFVACHPAGLEAPDRPAVRLDTR